MTRHFLASTACPTSSAPYTALVCVALASLGACGTAQAQSSLTIYGIVDQGLARANGGTTPGALLPGRGVTGRVEFDGCGQRFAAGDHELFTGSQFGALRLHIRLRKLNGGLYHHPPLQ